jgi:hypothetical protein
LSDAEARGIEEITVIINMNYRHMEDLRNIFSKIEAVVRQIAAVLPGGVKRVKRVIVTPARGGQGDKIPARWTIELHDGT